MVTALTAAVCPVRAQEEALQSRVLAGLEELAAHSSAHESRLRALEGGGASPRPGPPPAAAEGGGGGGGGVASNDVAALKEWLSAQLAEIRSDQAARMSELESGHEAMRRTVEGLSTTVTQLQAASGVVPAGAGGPDPELGSQPEPEAEPEPQPQPQPQPEPEL